MSRSESETFYGWRMVGVVFAMQALGSGAIMHAFGVFVKPVAEEFGASRMLTVLGPAAAALVGVTSVLLILFAAGLLQTGRPART